MIILSTILSCMASIVGFAIGARICKKIFGQSSLLDAIYKWVNK